MKYNTARPFLAAYILMRKNNEIALLLRKNTRWMDRHYSLPAGKAEVGESIIQAAIREAKEETGVEVKEENLTHVHTMHRYELNENSDDDRYWVDIFFETDKWSGKVFNAEPEVHGELIWVTANDLPKNMVPNVQYAIEQIEKGNKFSEYGWEKT